MNKNDIVAYNKDQLEHIRLLQTLVFKFCNNLMACAIEHDKTKFDDREYWGFIDNKEALSQSKDGKDDSYQKGLKSDAIQNHIRTNPHHPEYWADFGKHMPVEQAIIMFFDWYSRCLQKGGSLDNFWDYNISKLENQPEAKHLVEYMKKDLDERKILAEKFKMQDVPQEFDETFKKMFWDILA